MPKEKTGYHIGCGVSAIFAGVLKNQHEWRTKSAVTEEAIAAVRDWMVSETKPGDSGISYSWHNSHKKHTVKLTLTIEPDSEDPGESVEK